MRFFFILIKGIFFRLLTVLSAARRERICYVYAASLRVFFTLQCGGNCVFLHMRGAVGVFIASRRASAADYCGVAGAAKVCFLLGPRYCSGMPLPCLRLCCRHFRHAAHKDGIKNAPAFGAHFIRIDYMYASI